MCPSTRAVHCRWSLISEDWDCSVFSNPSATKTHSIHLGFIRGRVPHACRSMILRRTFPPGFRFAFESLSDRKVNAFLCTLSRVFCPLQGKKSRQFRPLIPVLRISDRRTGLFSRKAAKRSQMPHISRKKMEESEVRTYRHFRLRNLTGCMPVG